MQLTLFVVGKLKKNATTMLFEQYYNRIHNIAKNIGITNIILKEISESKQHDAALRCIEEGKKLLALVNDGTRLIICDELGINLNSKEFSAKLLKEISMATNNIIFAIGGAHGFSMAVKEAAHGSISFGKLTWPHQLARIMLVEQIYRAITITLNHPYHRD